MTKPLVILSSSESTLDLQAAAMEVGVVPLIAAPGDVLWLAKQLCPTAVVLDVPADPPPDHPLFELARLARSTGMAVIARRERFVESSPCEAARLVFVEAADGVQHLASVLDGLLATSQEPDFDIEIDTDLTWTLEDKRAA
ncbi:MAG: hypothetical protein ACJ790_08585 [Myxococcaceae bacterium]